MRIASRRGIEACSQFRFVAVSVEWSVNIEISGRNPFSRKIGTHGSLRMKSVSPAVSPHVNSMHLFGDAELEQGLRPQAEVGALAV